MAIQIRSVRDEEEFDLFHRTEELAFGTSDPADGRRDGRRQAELTVLPLDRTVAAFDGDRLVGTAGDYPFEMTVPGGGTVPVAGVTAVSVSTSHRRQGILRQMMQHQLDEVAGRGEPIAVLNASEAAIYGRFGYGLAQWFQSLRMQTRYNAFREPVRERSLPMRILDRVDARPVVPARYDECRLGRPGMLTQSEAWWDCVFSELETWKGGGPVSVVVADPDPVNGTGGGFAVYEVSHEDRQPGEWKVFVRFLLAADPVVEAQLWRFLLDIDLMGEVHVDAAPVDALVRWLLVNPRAMEVTRQRDYLFVRLLDIERSLAARTYATPDELVVEVFDPFRPANDGCYAVKGGPDGASCERVDRAPDLSLDVEELGALYLGGVLPSRLAAAGRLTEQTPGAVARADLFFPGSVAPLCTTRF